MARVVFSQKDADRLKIIEPVQKPRRMTLAGAAEKVRLEELQSKAKKAVVKKPSKYRNKPTTVDGIVFDSAREASDYGKLKLRVLAGEITKPSLQVKYPLLCDTIMVRINANEAATPVKLPYKLIKEYIADFVYTEIKTGKIVVQDSKGMKTKSFRLKKRLMKILYGIDILES